jgi:hypothetical protein
LVRDGGMIPPVGKSGFPTVSATQLRAYGAGGFRLDEQEAPRGCPRQYRARYVERRVAEEWEDPDSNLMYGRVFHEVMALLAVEDLTPEQAVDRVFPAAMDPRFWSELVTDLTRYLERPSTPLDQLQTLGAELDMETELFVDADFGPVWYRSILDLVSLDPDDLGTVHVTDYKTNRRPPSNDDVLGDVQMKGYAWSVRQVAEKHWGIVRPRVVVHLDAVKYREVEVVFADETLDEWHDWACALVRKILRDDEAEPRLHPDCSFCPVRGDCPAFLGLPEMASSLAGQLQELEDPVEKLRWRDAANRVRLLLEKSVKQIDEAFKAEAARQGVLVVGDEAFVQEQDWATVSDLRALHRALGDRFYDVVTPAMTRLKAVQAGLPPDQLAATRQAVQRAPVGWKVTRRKAGDGD